MVSSVVSIMFKVKLRFERDFSTVRLLMMFRIVVRLSKELSSWREKVNSLKQGVNF